MFGVVGLILGTAAYRPGSGTRVGFFHVLHESRAIAGLLFLPSELLRQHCLEARSRTMRTWKWVVVCMVALPAVVATAQTAATRSSRDITLRITPEKSTVSVNQPVDVLMTLENPGHQRLSVDFGDDRKGNLTIEMINPFGERTKKKLARSNRHVQNTPQHHH